MINAHKNIIELSAFADECIAEIMKNQEIEMSEDDEFDFENATCCHTCKTNCRKHDKRVRYHDHRTGKYRGCAHDRCNISYFSDSILILIFHI